MSALTAAIERLAAATTSLSATPTGGDGVPAHQRVYPSVPADAVPADVLITYHFASDGTRFARVHVDTPGSAGLRGALLVTGMITTPATVAGQPGTPAEPGPVVCAGLAAGWAGADGVPLFAIPLRDSAAALTFDVTAVPGMSIIYVVVQLLGAYGEFGG